ncbi:hypothetical protein [Acidithiobacillus sulfuriphilus]|uniref:hypothetical protein n=1 Tax=Acidithiobacillus sulfuriphilus TaxID=1867749 RepID=UPI003F60E82A
MNRHGIFSAGCTLLLAFGLASTAVAGAASAPKIHWKSERITLPTSDLTFTGPGGQVLNTYCLMCHSADFVNEQPAVSLATWKVEVSKMKNAFGAPIPEDQIDHIAEVLYQRFGPPKP